MTREEVARRIHWGKIIMLVGYLNVFIGFPQLITLLRSRSSDGLSVTTFAFILIVQAAFSLHGYFRRDQVLCYSNVVAVFVTSGIVLRAMFLRYP